VDGVFRAIWEIVARIPRGRVATYGQIARMAGVPGGARTVGWAMRALPDDLRIRGREVPWHRVINAQGRPSPRRNDAGGDGAASQALRLRREGVLPGRGGRIDLARRLWRGDRR
jgi:methylated-DNA-protein-cysteine methyltransferase-like protein